jgi:type IV pilus assembly protein PilM
LAKAVGIDIGSRACKVAVLAGGPKGARLKRYVEKEYDLGEAGALTPAAVLAALRKALAEARAPKDSASLAVPAEHCTLREISVPFTEDDQIAKTAKFEFEPHLHSSAIENVVIDYVKTGAAKSGTRLLVFCATKEMLRTRLAQLRDVGVDPLHLDVDVAALFNTAHAAKVFEKHPNCLVIDIGARTTKTLVVQGGKLKVGRSIRLGSQGALTRLTEEFEGDRAVARRAMDDAGGVEALARAPAESATTLEIVASVRDIEAAAAGAQESEFLSRVLRETRRTLPAIAEDQPLTRVFLTGGGARRAHARERIREQFGVDVEDLPTLTAVAHDLPPSEADKIAISGAVAIGAGLKVLGIDAGEIDLRRDDLRFARTFDQVKVALAAGVTLVFFALFLLGFAQYLQREQVRKERRAMQELVEKELRTEVLEEYETKVKEARMEKEADRQRSRDPEFYFSAMKTRLGVIRNHLKNELGLSTSVQPIRSCLETWSAVFAAAREVRAKVPFMAFREEKYNQEKADLKVIFGDYPDIDQLVGALRKRTEIFDQVETDRPTNVKDKGIEVPIKGQLQVKESAESAAAEPAGDTSAPAPAAVEEPAPAQPPASDPPPTPPGVAPPGVPPPEAPPKEAGK